MNQISRKLLAALLTLALLCSLTVHAGAANTGKKLVLLGDSIAEGGGASDLSTKSYAQLLAKDGYQVSNFAVGAHKTSGLLKVLAENEDARHAIREADIINISIGGNDLVTLRLVGLALWLIILKDTSTMNNYLKDFRKNFAQVIAEIRALNKDGRIIVLTVYNPMQGVPVVGDAYDLAIGKLNEEFYEYLKNNPGAFEIADTYGAFKGREGLVFRDWTHPSDDGHAMIARVLAAVIEGEALVLEPAPPPPELNFFQRTGLFFRDISEFLVYWISNLSMQEVIDQLFG